MFYCFSLCIYDKVPRSVAHSFWFVYLVILQMVQHLGLYVANDTQSVTILSCE